MSAPTPQFLVNQTHAKITALIAAGADVNARDKNGWTALMVAAGRNENPAVVIALLDAGAEQRCAKPIVGWKTQKVKSGDPSVLTGYGVDLTTPPPGGNPQNQWPLSVGAGGRITSEPVAGMRRNANKTAISVWVLQQKRVAMIPRA